MLILHRESFRDPDAVCDLLAGHIPSAWKGEGGEREGLERRETPAAGENDLLKSKI